MTVLAEALAVNGDRLYLAVSEKGGKKMVRMPSGHNAYSPWSSEDFHREAERLGWDLSNG
jgi:hypothetical protein